MNLSQYRLNKIHFIGIGGSGMSGIAEVLNNLGYVVSGSDTNSSENTARLEKMGIDISYDHKAKNLDSVEMVVKSTAIAEDNPELIEARRKFIPILARAEMLSSLMNNKRGVAIAGTHGKTTTTSLVASIMSDANLDPTFINGGIIKSINSNAQLGQGEYLIAEADESDKSFLLLQPSISIITNIEPDHLINYDNDFGNLKEAFLGFIKNLPFNGVSIVCGDDKVVNEIKNQFQRNHISYGFDLSNDFVICDYETDGLKSTFKIKWGSEVLELTLNMLGRHNVLNASAAAILCMQEGISTEIIRESLENFMGIDRRMQILGEKQSRKFRSLYIDDYGHHPTEIKNTIKAVRESYPDFRLKMIFQPHRFTRTNDLYKEFVEVLKEVDELTLLDIYSAGENEIEGISSSNIKKSLEEQGYLSAELLSDKELVIKKLHEDTDSNDVFIFQGAGDISSISQYVAKNFF